MCEMSVLPEVQDGMGSTSYVARDLFDAWQIIPHVRSMATTDLGTTDGCSHRFYERNTLLSSIVMLLFSFYIPLYSLILQQLLSVQLLCFL